MAVGNSQVRPALVLLSGLPGSGKTTFATALVQVLSAAHVESDALRREMAANPRYTVGENGAVFQRAEKLARLHLRRGRHVVLDATNLTTRDRRRFIRVARDTDARLVCVRVTAPEDVVRARLRQPRLGFSQATVAIYEAMRLRARPFAFPAVVVDTRFSLAPSLGLVAMLARGGD